jgi:hypothetical protein
MTYRAKCLGHHQRTGKGRGGSARAIRRQLRKAFAAHFREMYPILRFAGVARAPSELREDLEWMLRGFEARGWIAEDAPTAAGER